MIAVCLCLPVTAAGSQSTEISASFTPYKLGGATTIGFDFHIGAPAGQIPSALTDVEVRYPENLGFALSGLGISVCSVTALEAIGTSGCPPDSIMGRGSALAELQIGQQIVSENASISIARAPDQEGHIALLIYAVGPSPVNTRILSPAQLLPSSRPFGGRLNIQPPLVPSVPEAPDVAITGLHITLGPQGLIYYETTAGATLAYTPKGILLPKACPRGGFRFAATFAFLDGSHPTAQAVIPCKMRQRRHQRRLRTPPSSNR